MARYTGPKVRVSRRLGINIYENEKGRKALDRRPFPPGQHGRTRRRNAGSEYLAQLQEKQKAKYIYCVLERQFRNTYEEAVRLQGPTGENLLRLLEQRLDNIVYRAGWASTRPQARQFVSHGLIHVNGKRVNIASYRVRRGEVISLPPSPVSSQPTTLRSITSRVCWITIMSRALGGRLMTSPLRTR